jgi:hypothetical protein
MILTTARQILILLAFAGALTACDTMGGDTSSATGAARNTSATAPSDAPPTPSMGGMGGY